MQRRRWAPQGFGCDGVAGGRGARGLQRPVCARHTPPPYAGLKMADKRSSVIDRHSTHNECPCVFLLFPRDLAAEASPLELAPAGK